MRFLLAVVVLFAFAQPAGDDPIERQRVEVGGAAAFWKPAIRRHELPSVGLSVVVPRGWRVVRRPRSPCTDPVHGFALSGRGATVQIVESIGYGVDGFPPRPKRFELRGKAQYIPCCPPADGKGWFIPFRDSGRGFYAYVYLGAPETRAHALLVLDSLRVRPRR